MLTGKTWLRCLFASALTIPSAQGQAANLLTNGSFEAPDVVVSAFLNPGSIFIPGWTVAAETGSAPGTQVQISDNVEFGPLGVVASDGVQYLDLTGYIGRGGGVVSDGFATAAGTSYRVSFDIGSFWVAGYGSYGDVTVDLFVNNGFVQSFTNAQSLAAAGTDWDSVSWDFVGTGAPMTIGLFSSLLPGSSSLGVGLDNVSVDLIGSSVPEPASWAMMLGGLGLAGAVLRRRRTLIAFA